MDWQVGLLFIYMAIAVVGLVCVGEWAARKDVGAKGKKLGLPPVEQAHFPTVNTGSCKND